MLWGWRPSSFSLSSPTHQVCKFVVSHHIYYILYLPVCLQFYLQKDHPVRTRPEVRQEVPVQRLKKSYSNLPGPPIKVHDFKLPWLIMRHTLSCVSSFGRIICITIIGRFQHYPIESRSQINHWLWMPGTNPMIFQSIYMISSWNHWSQH